MSEQTAEILPRRRTPFFRGSLVRTLVFLFVFLALIPAVIIGVSSYVRYQNSLMSSLSTQLQAYGTSYALQVEQLVASNTSFTNKVASAATITGNLSSYEYGIFSSTDTAGKTTVNQFLEDQVTSSSSQGIVEIDIVSPRTGYVYSSSNSDRIGTYLARNDALGSKSLYGTDQTVLVYDPGGLFPYKMMLVTSQMIQKSEMPEVSLLVFTNPNALSSLLSTPVETYASAYVFYITTDDQVVSMNSVLKKPVSINVTGAQLGLLGGYAEFTTQGTEYSYTSYTGIDVYSYIQPLNTVDAYYFIEIPHLLITNQLITFRNFLLLILGATLGLSGIVAFFGARQIAVPLVQLSSKARLFAEGDFSQKADVSRRDEIGMLAQSFNYMVDQLSAFYASLESKVADRTKQLQVATEIGQEAISAPRVSEILGRAAKATVDQFAIPFVAIYLVDEKRKIVTLAELSSTFTEGLPQIGLQIPIDNTSLLGWVANNGQVRISQDITNERPKLSDTGRMISSQSEFAIPIKVGERLLGVLDFQSDIVNAFDLEALPAYTVLANQIATGVRNIELLEATQLSLQETALLNRYNREISQADSEEQVYSLIGSLFSQTSYACFTLDLVENNAVITSIGDAKTVASDKSLLGISIEFKEAIEKLANEGFQIVGEFRYLTEFSNLTPYFGRRGCRSVALIPVYEGKRLLHLLAIGSRDEETVKSDQVLPYTSLGESVGASLEKIHLFKKLTKSDEEFSTFRDIIQNGLEISGITNLSLSVHERIRLTYGVNLGFCVVINDSVNGQINIPYFGDKEVLDIEPYGYSDDLVSQLIKESESQYLYGSYISGKVAINSPAFQQSVRSWAGYPMIIGGKVIGAIAFFNSEQSDPFDEEFLKVSALIASQFTLVISNQLVQMQLHESENLYEQEKFMLESLLENIPDLIYFKGRNNEFLRISKSMASFLGVGDRSDLVGRSDDYRYVKQDEENHANIDNELISTLVPVLNKEETWNNRLGTAEAILTNKTPLVKQDGEIFGILNISKNITEQLKTEQLAEHRANQLLTASEIAKESTTGSMDIQVTLARLVELIRSRFGFYHASIFMIDPLGKNAVLRESTGEAGAQMKSAGHKLAVGSTSIVGQATGKGVPVVIGDVTKEENYFANPLLPETRSELAIPLMIGENILGALDVQSTLLDAFQQEDINILQVLADQIAVAIQNADLYTRTNQSLVRYRLLHQITSTNAQTLSVEDAIHGAIEVLHQAMPDERITFFGVSENNFMVAQFSAGYPTPDLTTRRIQVGQGAIGVAARDLTPVRINDVQADPSSRPLGYDSNSILAVPVVFANQLLGVLNIEGLSLAQFDEADQEFVTSLADNMASIISNIRLLEQVRDQVDRQRRLFEITTKIRRSVDIETIMQTSLSEICTAMNVPRATIKISTETAPEEEGEKEKRS